MVASHYAEPVHRAAVAPAVLRMSPSDDAEPIREIASGEPFAMLDESLGWAWGYAGQERRAGYVRADAIG